MLNWENRSRFYCLESISGMKSWTQVPTRKRGGNPEKAGIPPRFEKDGHLSETAFRVSGRYPEEADKGGEEACPFSRRGADPEEREGQHIALLRRGHQRPDPTKGWGMAAGGKKEERKEEK